MAIVEFTKDCYPYCKGDRIELSEEEQKDVDALAKQREVSKPYKIVEDPKVPESTETVKAVEEPDGERVKPVLPSRPLSPSGKPRWQPRRKASSRYPALVEVLGQEAEHFCLRYELTNPNRASGGKPRLLWLEKLQPPRQQRRLHIGFQRPQPRAQLLQPHDAWRAQLWMA